MIRLLTFLLLCAPLHAATFYCGPASTGAGTGANFSNLIELPTTTGFNRGDVYVVVDGSYGNRTLSEATSSTTTVTIRKANAAQDSGVTGYVDTLHDGVAAFGTLNIVTQYWIVDGITRTESNAWGAPAGYGMSASWITASSLDGDDADNSQFSYIDIGPTYDTAPSSGTINTYGTCINLVYNQTNISFTRCALHNYKGTGLQGAGADNLTFDHCDIGPGWGKEALRGGNGSESSGWTVKFCRFWNASQTDPNDGSSGITAEIGMWDADTGSFDNNLVYGNWFFSDKTGARNAVIVIGGDGSGWVGVGGTGNVVYNNTFVITAEGSVFPMVDINGSGNVARNNLFYDCVDTDVSATTTSDNDVAGADPFVSYGTLDFRLSGATGAGTTLSSPYDTDPLGVTRGADGTFDVGAYEYNAGGGGADETINTTNFNVTNLIVE